MKYLDEYRDPKLAMQLSRQIHKMTTKPWVIMEVCGGQTHAIVKYGIDTLLPDKIELVHGPGCPVCVTPLEIIDRALAIAVQKNVIFCSFGDMLRVPGSKTDLLSVKAQGADVRIVYSPLDAVKIAEDNPQQEIVFFAVGFETTAPANAMAVHQAKELGLKNFSLLVSHVLVPPAMEAVLSSKLNRVQGFLAAGHVCAVMGYSEYPPIANKYKVPIIVTGFEPLDILQGIAMCVRQLQEGRHEVENQYVRSVELLGNLHAQDLVSKVFRVISHKWRGIGEIPQSGFCLRSDYKDFDAEIKFNVGEIKTQESPECLSGLVLQGVKKPYECPAFGIKCTPQQPLGATMVSSEGACAAYYRYKRIPSWTY
jgi:hydrogenase expression/formation protein HypD